jgi:broad specificity phosphatase PhoE
VPLGTKIQPRIVADLREVDFGRWENLAFDEIPKRDSARLDRWAAFDPTFRFPAGERLGDFLARTRRVAREIARAPEDTLLVVTHGGVIRSLLCRFLRLPPRRYVAFNPSPGSLTVLELFENGGGVLTALLV